MPKNKFKLSKKHEWLINAICFEIPEPWKRFNSPLEKGESAKNKTIILLMKAVQVLTRNTIMQNSADEFLGKCQKVFDYTDRE